MNSQDIHHGLDRKEIRDFLSGSLCKLYKEENNNVKEHIKYNPDTIQYAIDDMTAHVKWYTKRIEILKQRAAVLDIIKMCEWKEFDVSDETHQSPIYNDWMAFIGTEEEYNSLINFLKYETSGESSRNRK